MNVKLLDLQAQYRPLREEIRRAIDQVCDEQSLVLGPHVEQFEKTLAGYCHTTDVVGVSSGTDALLCSLMALGIKAGDEVICPSFTFFATAGSIVRTGATPVFCEVDPHTFNVDPEKIKPKITSRTRAILPVHLFGQTAAMDAINAIAREHGLVVLEDAAQAIGAKRDGQPACSLSFAGCLSFYPTKNLGAFGDAGAICTSNAEFAQKCRLLRVHGSGHTYQHALIGGMFRLSAIQAAVLSVKIEYLDRWHEARRKNAALYDQLFEGAKVIRPRIDPRNKSVYHQYCVRLANREAVRERLGARGIATAVYYPIPLHLQECFAYLKHNVGDFPESERVCREILALPIYPELTEEQIRYVAAELRAATA